MPYAQWSLQDAKNQFSAVVKAARQGGPQIVTKRGTPAVVIVAAEAFQELERLQRLQSPAFNECLLSMPTDDEPFARGEITPREIGL